MNKTRHEWSSTFKCCRDKRDSLTAFYSLCSAIFIIAITFYCSVYCVGIRRSSADILDERDLQPSSVDGPITSAGSSSSTSASTNGPIKKAKNPQKSIIDDESDEEILDVPTTHANNNLVQLD